MNEVIRIPNAAARLVEVLRARPGAVPENVVLLETDLDADTCREQIPVLRSAGYDLLRLPNGAYQLLGASDRMLPNEIERHLDTEWVGKHLACYEEVDSTNAVAAKLARAGAVGGTVVVADGQTKGRGRLGRSWVSPPRRNLYLSVVLRPDLPAAELSRLSLMAGVAVCDAVAKWCPAFLKWPNDVLVEGRKVAGILMETEGDGPNRFVILGVGVNLNVRLDEFPPELRTKAGSLSAATGTSIDRPRFAACVLGELERWLGVMGREGFGAIAQAWESRAQLSGRKITVDGPDGQIGGIALGLDADGALRVQLPGGEVRSVLAGDVTVVGGYGDR